MKNSKTTIIVTSHNYAHFLKECLDSLLSQSICPKEVIVIDDASSDNPKKIVESFLDKLELRFYSVNYKNAQKARNFGLEKAVGEYILFLDADDYLRDDFLEKTENVLDQKNKIDCVYSDRENFGVEGILQKIGQKKEWKTRKFDYGLLKKYNYISLPALVRKDVFTGFDERVNRFQDWDAWLTFLKSRVAVHIPEPLFFVRFHGKNKTFSTNKYIEKVKVLMKHNLIGFEKVENVIKGKSKTQKKKRAVIIVGRRKNYDNVLDYLKKLHDHKNCVHVYFTGLDRREMLSIEVSQRLSEIGCRYRIVRCYGVDEMCDYIRVNHLSRLYSLNFFNIFGSVTKKNISRIAFKKYTHGLLWDSEKKDYLNLRSLDEGNWALNKKGIRIFFNL